MEAAALQQKPSEIRAIGKETRSRQAEEQEQREEDVPPE